MSGDGGKGGAAARRGKGRGGWVVAHPREEVVYRLRIQADGERPPQQRVRVVVRARHDLMHRPLTRLRLRAVELLLHRRLVQVRHLRTNHRTPGQNIGKEGGEGSVSGEGISAQKSKKGIRRLERGDIDEADI